MTNSKKYDWHKLKLEYMSSNMSLTDMVKKYNFGSPSNFMINARGWVKERKALKSRALARAEQKVETALANQYVDHLDMWVTIKDRIRKIMKAGRITKNNGIVRFTRPIDPSDLVSLATSLEKALKCERLIHGHSTENIDHGSLYKAVVDEIESTKQ